MRRLDNDSMTFSGGVRGQSFHGMSEANCSELLTWGAQHITRNITSNKFVRAT